MMKCMDAEASARHLKSQASDLGVAEKVDGRVPSNPRAPIVPPEEWHADQFKVALNFVSEAFLQAR